MREINIWHAKHQFSVNIIFRLISYKCYVYFSVDYNFELYIYQIWPNEHRFFMLPNIAPFEKNDI